MKLTHKEKVEILNSALSAWLSNQHSALNNSENTGEDAGEVAFHALEKIEELLEKKEKK